MSRRRLTRIVLIGLVAAVAAAPVALAAGAPVPGARYKGVGDQGVLVSFTLSSDGTLVTSYQLFDVPGNNCSFSSAAGPQGFPGVPIVRNAFSYDVHPLTSVVFDGTFTGPASASGTLRLYQSATGQTPACDSGTLNWTATTTSTPPGGPGSGSGGSGGSSGSGGPGHHKPFLTRITLRRASLRWLTGQIASPAGACRAGRKVFLWRGLRRIATTKAKAGGKFSFPRSVMVRGRAVRASTATMNVKSGVCAAGSSKFIKG
jgi:hypothetical protein